MSNPWGIGAWAAEAERAEAEEMEAAAAAAAAAAPPEAYPTLGESQAVKPKKKKQQQTFSISEFTYGKSVSHGSKSRSSSDSRGLTTEEMMMLPTGPRDRSGEEDQRGGLGGAFRDYRGGTDRFDRERDRGSFGGGYERDREAGGFLRDRERDEPSRADDSSNWSSSKKTSFSGGGYDGERRGSRMADRDLPPSRADEVDNWGLVKKSLPLAPADARSSGRRETFDEGRQHFRADEGNNWASSKKTLPPPPGQDAAYGHSRADEADNWSSSKRTLAAGRDSYVQDMSADAGGRWGRRQGNLQQQTMEEQQRRRLVLAPRSGPRSPSPPPGLRIDAADASDALPPPGPRPKPNPFGSARPREDVLADRGPDLQRPENEYDVKEQDSRPSSSHSGRPDTPEVSAESVVRPRPRPKVNPFGNAKPREVLLQERGKDWRKLDFDLEHRGVDRPETERETMLKEEIKMLTELSKQEKEAGAQRINGVVPDQNVDQDAKPHSISEELHIKEKELEQLIRDLDDKVRFSQKIGDRPGSRSGRSDVGRSFDLTDRPGSRSGSRPGSRSGRSETGRNFDSLERPGSHLGRKTFDSSERPHSHSGYGGGRGLESGDRSWSRAGQLEGGRNHEALERRGSWIGSSESGRSFESLQRSRWHTAALPTEVGSVSEYPPEVGGPDIWTRSNEGGRDRQGSWGERGRLNDRPGMRRF